MRNIDIGEKGRVNRKLSEEHRPGIPAKSLWGVMGRKYRLKAGSEDLKRVTRKKKADLGHLVE